MTLLKLENLDYNLRSQMDFIRTCVSTSSFGLSSLKELAGRKWDIFPYDIKSVGNLNSFQKKIKNCEPEGCHSRLYKQFIRGIGYVENFLYLLFLTIIFIF